jgi:tetratricopeptide (TPR) repeat protein
MGIFRRLFGGALADGASPKPQRLDYLNEALALERQGDYDAAITSYRLALRDHPNDPRILQNLAIALSRTGQVDDALRHYRKALEADPTLAGAHYGLGFLLLKRGDIPGAEQHLKAFLGNPPKGVDAQRWVEHAERALADLSADAASPRPAKLEGA